MKNILIHIKNAFFSLFYNPSGLIVLIVAFGIGYIHYEYKKREILKDKDMTKALIIGYRLNSKGDIGIDYYYIVNNDTINGNQRYDINYNAGKFLINKYFPIIYSKKDITNHQILIEEKDFNDFEVPYPDSLRWIKKFRW